MDSFMVLLAIESMKRLGGIRRQVDEMWSRERAVTRTLERRGTKWYRVWRELTRGGR
jgi:hypothetical protein